VADAARAQCVPWSADDAALLGKETAGYHKRTGVSPPVGAEVDEVGGSMFINRSLQTDCHGAQAPRNDRGVGNE